MTSEILSEGDLSAHITSHALLGPGTASVLALNINALKQSGSPYSTGVEYDSIFYFL